MEPTGTGTPARSQLDQTRNFRVLLGLLFLVIAIAVPTAIFFTYQRLRMDTSLTREAQREDIFKRLDAARPQDLSMDWESYSTMPLGQPQKPAFYHVQRAARSLEWRIGIAGGVALLAAIAAASLIVANRQARDSIPPSQTHAGL